MTDANPLLYRINEGAFPAAVPSDWDDQTINVLRVPGHGHATASLVVTRETLPLGKDIAGYVQDQLRALAREMPDFKISATIPILYPDQRCEAVCASWQTPDGPMDQVLCCVGVGPRRVLIFTGTHPSPMPEPLRRQLIQIIAGFRPHPAQPIAQIPAAAP
jgi:hypothetical protein